MPFVNEIPSDEDRHNFGLQDLLRRYFPKSSLEVSKSWTIDREKKAFLVEMQIVHSLGPSGREEPTARSIWVFVLNNHATEFTLERTSGTSRSTSERPYRIVWALVDSKPIGESQVQPEELLGMLKEALTVYGELGAHLQVPDTHVDFKF